MHLLEGSVGVHGSLAYVPQQAWIIQGSIRENIILGRQYDKARYAFGGVEEGRDGRSGCGW